MAMITEQNAIRYCIDNLNTSSYGVIITRTGSESDFTGVSQIEGFSITSTQPAGTVIKFLFSESGSQNWFKLNTSGNAVNILTGTPEYEDIVQGGNTAGELRNLSEVPAFTGKKILTAIALGTPDIKNAIPKVKLSFKCRNSTQTLTHSEYSPLYELGQNGQISNIHSDVTQTGDAKAELYAQLTRSDGGLSEWLPASSLSGQKCTHVKLRADYSVKALNTGSAKLDMATLTYTDGAILISGAGAGEIISLTQDWYMNVRHCRMNIRHAPLINSRIEAYVCFRKRPVQIQSEQLGIGTGKRAVYQLEQPDGLKYDTVKLFYDNQRVFADYEVNCEVGRITCTAPEGEIITVNYESGWESETWQKMNLHYTDSLEDYDVSEFRYTRPENDTENKSVCAVKIKMLTTSGSIKKESIGTGTGKIQTYKLSHQVSDGKVSIYSGSTAMSAKSYTLSEDSQYVRIAANSGAKLSASYNWVSETPLIYQFASVFAA